MYRVFDYCPSRRAINCIAFELGVDKTRNRTRTGGRGLGLADADSDWRTRTRGPTKKIEKYFKEK